MSPPFLQLGQTLGNCSVFTLSAVVLASSFVSPSVYYYYHILANSKS